LTKGSSPSTSTPTLRYANMVRSGPFKNHCPWSRVENNGDSDESGVDARVQDGAVKLSDRCMASYETSDSLSANVSSKPWSGFLQWRGEILTAHR
jgi:hypothetical protein